MIGTSGFTSRAVPPEQQPAFVADVRPCEAGLNLPEDTEVSEQFITDRYYALFDVKSCLERLGYEIEEPTSIETFIEDWQSGAGPWDPYDSVPNAALEEADQVCPQR